MNQIIADKLEEVLRKVQLCNSSHQKNLKILEQIYRKVDHQEFVCVLIIYLKRKIFPIRNEYAERILQFLAQFVTCLVSILENEDEDEDDSASQEFLREIVSETLKLHNVETESVRFNSCLFLRLILQNIDHEARLDNDICDLIQEAMLERTNDPKSAIRHQAVLALIRLQDPSNTQCPVIKAYLSLIVDSNALIRTEVVKNIAPFSVTLPHILHRLRDTDVNVRIMALRRCADLGPKHFKIVERQNVINCGLAETQSKAKKVFVDNLLMQWLNAYSRNFVEFFVALSLDADENDIICSEELSKEVLTVMFESVPIKEIIASLHLKDKLIPVDCISGQNILIWNIVSNFLRKSDDLAEFLDEILPELTPFCGYIESIFNKKEGSTPMNEWQNLQYQSTLYNLFEIVEKYDFSDEVGRRRLNQLIFTILKDEEIESRLMKKIVSLAEKLKSKSDNFIEIICHLISEIREPLIEKPVSQEDSREINFLKAQMKVKLNILEGQIEDALDMQEFLKVDSLKEEINKIEEELKRIPDIQPVVDAVKVSKDETKTICRSLDVLIALLQLPSTTKLTTCLVSVKDEFVLPLLKHNYSEVHWRVLNCIALYCLLDQSLAEEYIKILSIPIITYHTIPNHNKLILTTSVKAMSDLLRIYGAKIFGNIEDSSHNTISLNSTKRRLYRNNDEENTLDPNKFHFESIIEIVLDMLDDENPEICDCSVMALTKLILNNFPVTPLLITRIILKWYNPLTARSSNNVQQILGVLIANYTNSINGSREIVSEAVVPILTSISRAPRTSPLADVDIDNLLQFLAAITNSGNKRDVVNTHLNLAHILCHEIMRKKDCPVVLYFSKLLVYLDIPYDNVTALKELTAEVKIILEEEIKEKKYLMKFVEKLNDLLKQASVLDTSDKNTTIEVERDKENSCGDNETSSQLLNTIERIGNNSNANPSTSDDDENSSSVQIKLNKNPMKLDTIVEENSQDSPSKSRKNKKQKRHKRATRNANKRKKLEHNISDNSMKSIETNSDSKSPKKKTLKVVCHNADLNNLSTTNNDTRTKKGPKLIVNITPADISRATNTKIIHEHKVDHTMTFNNLTLDHCSFRPVSESTAVGHSMLPGTSSLTPDRVLRSRTISTPGTSSSNTPKISQSESRPSRPQRKTAKK